LQTGKSGKKKKYDVNLHRDYLKDKRHALGWTLEDVGWNSDISKDYYSQIENGFRGKQLSVKMLIHLSNVLQLDICTAIKEEIKFIELENEMIKITEGYQSG